MLDNKNLYNDKELFDDADLNWYDYGFRNYDAQIGRFTQLDPLTWDYPELTNYQYGSNEPIANVDMDGLEAIGSTVASSVGNATVNQASFLENIVIKGLPQAAKSSGSVFSVAGSFFKGVGNNLWGAVKGVVHAVARLDKTIEGIGSLSTPVGSTMAGLAIYNGVNNEIDRFKNGNAETKAEIIGAGVGEVLQLLGGEVAQVGKVGKLAKVAEISEDVGKVAETAKGVGNVKYLGRMEDLKGIPRSQTILDELPNLGSAKANYYQNMSVRRRNLREGVTFKDASWFRPNSELAPTIKWPTRTVGQTFYGAERNLMKNKGLWP